MYLTHISDSIPCMKIIKDSLTNQRFSQKLLCSSVIMLYLVCYILFTNERCISWEQKFHNSKEYHMKTIIYEFVSECHIFHVHNKKLNIIKKLYIHIMLAPNACELLSQLTIRLYELRRDRHDLPCVNVSQKLASILSIKVLERSRLWVILEY